MKIACKLLVALEAEEPTRALNEQLRQAWSNSEEEGRCDRAWYIPVAQPHEKEEASCNTRPTIALATAGHSNY
jgi:hypothetical protein